MSADLVDQGKLTLIQLGILTYLRETNTRRSNRELAAILGVHVMTIRRAFAAFERLGLQTQQQTASRPTLAVDNTSKINQFPWECENTRPTTRPSARPARPTPSPSSPPDPPNNYTPTRSDTHFVRIGHERRAEDVLDFSDPWRVGTKLLTQDGWNVKNAKSMIGKWLKVYERDMVLSAFAEAEKRQPACYRDYIDAVLREKARPKMRGRLL